MTTADHDPALPAHVAIIMDGNGRWAQLRGEPRPEGHRAGAAAVRKIVREARRRGIQALTLFAFSEQNWQRPDFEVNALMSLLLQFLVDETWCRSHESTAARQFLCN